MAMSCSQCGVPVDPSDNFCGNCGTSATRSLGNASWLAPPSSPDQNLAHSPLDPTFENILINLLPQKGQLPRDRKLSGRRITKLSYTCLMLVIVGVSLIAWTTHSKYTLSAALVLAVGVALRPTITFAYKLHAAQAKDHELQLKKIEKIGHDAAFAREVIGALRLASNSSDGHLTPDIASTVEEDPFLKETWYSTHQELQRLYTTLGPPPMKALSGTRNG